MKVAGKRSLKRWGMAFGVAAMLSALSMTAEAADTFYTHNLRDGAVILTAKDCADGCKGHRIYGTGTEGIKVEGGQHKIILDEVNLDFNTAVQAKCPFDLLNDAEVEVELKGDNTLIGGPNAAGIQVPKGTKLTISGEKGTLTAGSKSNAAAIGVGSYGDKKEAGEITVESGTINATGGGSAPGIGGKNAKIQLNGGNIKAIAGDETSNGIEGELSSKFGKEVIVTASGSVPAKGKFNGVVWKHRKGLEPAICTVYGDAVIESTFQLKESQTLKIPENTSLTLHKLDTNFEGLLGNITGGDNSKGGVLIGVENKYGGGEIAPEVTQKKVLTEGDVVVGTNISYDGTDLKDKVLTVSTTRGEVDAKIGWVKTIDGKEWEEAEIKNAGTYTVKYTHPLHKGFSKTVTVSPVSLSDTSIKIEAIKDQTYTGAEIKPEVVLTCGPTKQTLGKDYTVEYTNNITPTNEAVVYINGLQGGNVAVAPSDDARKRVTFKIVPAPITKNDVKIVDDKDEFLYDGQEHKPAITVEVNGKKLEEGSGKDYKLAYPDDVVSAGKKEITVTVTGEQNGYYTGTVKVPYEITAKKLEINVEGDTGVQAKSREYDGTDKVAIEKVELKGVLEGDKDQVEVKTEGLMGTVKKLFGIDAGGVGSYREVTFDGTVTLIGDKAGNYSLETPKDSVKLKEEIKIAKANPPALELEGVDYEVSSDEETFEYTVKVKEPDIKYDVEYEYKMDDEEKWTKDPVFKRITPETKHVFWARVKGDNNVETGNIEKTGTDGSGMEIYHGIGKTTEITFAKLPQNPPKEFKLKYELNEDKVTYTATIPEVKNGEYQFEDAGVKSDWSDKNTKTDCLPNTEYIGYVRYKETKVYKASESVMNNETTPKMKVETPLIYPPEGERNFLNSIEVSIECGTKDADIYYTTNGQTPTTSSSKYENPFTVDTTTTVKAIAVDKEGNMENSAMASAQFVKATGDGIKTKLDIEEYTKEMEVPESLKEAGFAVAEDVMVQLCNVLTSKKGYTYENVAYYDITIEISADGKTWEKATIDNFPKGGVSITMPYPEGTGEKTNDFAVAHMFTETSERLGVKAGEIEEPAVTKTEEGVKFTVKSTSPVAIAWKEAEQNSGTNNGGTNGNGTDETGTNGSGDPAKVTVTGTNEPAGSGNEGGTTGTGTSGSGTDGSGSGTDAQSRLSSVLPKTGDPASFIPWIVLIVISVAVIIIVVRKKRR